MVEFGKQSYESRQNLAVARRSTWHVLKVFQFGRPFEWNVEEPLPPITRTLHVFALACDGCSEVQLKTLSHHIGIAPSKLVGNGYGELFLERRATSHRFRNTARPICHQSLCNRSACEHIT